MTEIKKISQLFADEAKEGAGKQEIKQVAEEPKAEEKPISETLEHEIMKEEVHIEKAVSSEEIQPVGYLGEWQVLAQKLDEKQKAMDAILAIIIKRLNWSNLVGFADEQGNVVFSVDADGCLKMFSLLGISFRVLKVWCEPLFNNKEIVEILKSSDKINLHYAYYCEGEVRIGNDCFTHTSMYSSKNKFFAKRYGNEIPVDEILPDNIRRAAISNCIREVARMLGIQRFTIEELIKYGKPKAEIEHYKQIIFQKKKGG